MLFNYISYFFKTKLALCHDILNAFALSTNEIIIEGKTFTLIEEYEEDTENFVFTVSQDGVNIFIISFVHEKFVVIGTKKDIKDAWFLIKDNND